jgi:hypothetical protein
MLLLLHQSTTTAYIKAVASKFRTWVNEFFANNAIFICSQWFKNVLNTNFIVKRRRIDHLH